MAWLWLDLRWGYGPNGSWTRNDVNTGWTAATGASIPDTTTRTDWVLDGAAQPQGIVIQECVDWNNDASLSCKTWVAMASCPANFPSATTTPVNSAYIQRFIK